MAAQLALHIIRRLQPIAPAEAGYHSCESCQILDTEERTPIADNDLRIPGDGICPLRRNRAEGVIVNPQQEPPSVPVVSLSHADQLLAAEWMERMRYPDKMRPRDRTTCILN